MLYTASDPKSVPMDTRLSDGKKTQLYINPKYEMLLFCYGKLYLDSKQQMSLEDLGKIIGLLILVSQ